MNSVPLVSDTKLELPQRWWRANAIAFVLSYLVYVPVVHGVTGAHPGPLTPEQLVAHTIGLLVVSGTVLAAQLRALERPFREHLGRLTWGSLWFVVVFWIGWYAFGPPANVFMSFVVLATATWIRTDHLAPPVMLKTMLVVIGMLSGLAARGKSPSL